MKKPVIGISGSVLVMEGGRFPGYRRSYVNEDYIRSVVRAGGIPVVLPMNDDIDVIDEYLDMIDGLIMSGGHDVQPLRYSEQPLQRIGQVLPERDEFDIRLINAAIEKEIPILGICRGYQILNVALGGSLYQDLSYIPGCNIKHDQYSSPSMATHDVTIENDSRLAEIFGKSRVKTNSFHHLAIKDLAEDLKITAKADDGIIEGVEHRHYPYVMGVQWHPEMMTGVDNGMYKLFKTFIGDCIKVDVKVN